jgi:TPR repeat protein
MSRLGKTALVVALAALLLQLTSCEAKEPAMTELTEIPASVKKQLAFTCVKEGDHVPKRDPEAEQLYRHARWLVKGNVLKQDPSVYPAIERLVRIATAYGHDRANVELRDMLEKGRATSPDPVNEIIDLVQDLIKRGIPAGYYDMGWYLEHGYGVRADQELAFKYYRKSADMGSPDGQYVVGDKLSDQSKHGVEIANIGWAMFRCAADQQHAKAANEFGIYLRQTKRPAEAMKYFQIAASAGNPSGANRLSEAFSARGNSDDVYGLGQAVDPERQRRYKAAWNMLADYEYLNAKIPEIDEIIPLPPAKLPPWDGQFKWVEEHKANVPPPLPTEARIVEMARVKGLDPKTGRPLGR